MSWSRTHAGAPTRRTTSRWLGDDALARLDTAPVDLEAVRRAGDAQRAPSRTGAGLRRGIVSVASLLLVGAAALVLVTVPARGPSSQAIAAPASAAQDTGWQNLELGVGWFATRDGARYRVENGICYLQLHVATGGGVWPANTEVGVLPASAAPSWNLGFAGLRAGQPFGEVKVFSTGRVLVVAPSAAAGGDITVSGAFPVG